MDKNTLNGMMGLLSKLENKVNELSQLLSVNTKPNSAQSSNLENNVDNGSFEKGTEENTYAEATFVPTAIAVNDSGVPVIDAIEATGDDEEDDANDFYKILNYISRNV